MRYYLINMIYYDQKIDIQLKTSRKIKSAMSISIKLRGIGAGDQRLIVC